jgi:hypothetical protein
MLDRNPAESAFLRRLEYQRRDRPPVSRRTPGIRAMTDPLGVSHRSALTSKLQSIDGSLLGVAHRPAPTLPLPSPATAPRKTAVPTLTANGMLKVVAVLDPASILDIQLRDGAPRCPLSIRFPDRASTVQLADLNAKSVRKAQATIRTEGMENVAALVQGR